MTSGEEAAVKLPPNLIAHQVSGGKIAENILQFARLLRASGLPVGPDRVILGTEAVLAAGIESPRVLYAALHASFVSRPEQREIFDQAFYLFWKDPGYLEQMLSLMLPSLRGAETDRGQEMNRRLRDSLLPQGQTPPQRPMEEVEFDVSESYSAMAVSRTKDFEQMSADEQRRARAAIARMTLLIAPLKTRRFVAARQGVRFDLRRMLRETATKGEDHIVLRHRDRAWRVPPLVVLCDISGSMDTYARMLLHFLYALTNARDRVHCFLFGTELYNITRMLKGKDPDAAIAKVSRDVTDWSGGTRIGESLEAFNKRWARRVLGGRATVLLFSDGLDREGGEGISLAARRLRASCRRLIWLNPLLRYDAYAPIAAGARELMPHVSEVRPCHNLASLEGLANALGDTLPSQRRK
jgi:uncharacterized protein